MLRKLLCTVVTVYLALQGLRGEDISAVMAYYQPNMSKGFIFVSKADMTLTLVNSKGVVEVTYPIACGRHMGQKVSKGDNRTPEGHFLLQRIHEASHWGHDFRDGKGFIPHAYGPWFLRLQTGFDGIGIHGTHAPESIGTRATEGCIRLENSNVADLKSRVTVGMPVIIGPEGGVKARITAGLPAPAPIAQRFAYHRPDTLCVRDSTRHIAAVDSAAHLRYLAWCQRRMQAEKRQETPLRVRLFDFAHCFEDICPTSQPLPTTNFSTLYNTITTR